MLNDLKQAGTERTVGQCQETRQTRKEMKMGEERKVDRQRKVTELCAAALHYLDVAVLLKQLRSHFIR